MFRRSLVLAAGFGDLIPMMNSGPEPLDTKIGGFGLAFVKSGNTAVVETFGKYTKTQSPGLSFYVPFIQSVRQVSNRTVQKTYEFETKTRDNIFTVLQVAAQYKVEPEDTELALYKVEDPVSLVHSYLDSEIRAEVSKRTLDDLFTEQEEISASVFTDRTCSKTGSAIPSVSSRLKEKGFTIESVLVRQIEPDKKVKAAMNAINASERMREAAKNEADAKYITEIRSAEADRDRMRLQGEGVAQQRQAIMKGYEDGVNAMSDRFGLSPTEVVDFVLKTQHLDALQKIAESPNAKTIFTEHQPRISIRDSFMQAQEGLSNDGRNNTAVNSNSSSLPSTQSITDKIDEQINEAAKALKRGISQR